MEFNLEISEISKEGIFITIEEYNQKVKEFNEKSKREFLNMLKFIFFGLIVIVVFYYTEELLSKLYPNVNYGLGIGYWGLCLCFVFYLIPFKRKKPKKLNTQQE